MDIVLRTVREIWGVRRKVLRESMEVALKGKPTTNQVCFRDCPLSNVCHSRITTVHLNFNPPHVPS